MLFKIDNLLLIGPTSVFSVPQSGQIVELAPAVVAFPDDTTTTWYDIERPASPFDNGIWTLEEFRRCRMFAPRWRGFGDLQAYPRDCYGYLKEKADGKVYIDSAHKDARNFGTRIECMVRPWRM
jgi:hypothetical protein